MSYIWKRNRFKLYNEGYLCKMSQGIKVRMATGPIHGNFSCVVPEARRAAGHGLRLESGLSGGKYSMSSFQAYIRMEKMGVSHCIRAKAEY